MEQARRLTQNGQVESDFRVHDACAWKDYQAIRIFWKHRGAVFFVLDVSFALLSFVVAYYMRFNVDFFLHAIPPTEEFTPSVEPYAKAAIFTTLVWVFLLWKEGCYRQDLHFSRSLVHSLEVLFNTGFCSLVFLMAMSFAIRYFLLSRIVYVIGFLLACSLLSMLRVCSHLVDGYFDDKCVTFNRVLLLGWTPEIGALLGRLRRQLRCTEIVGTLGWGPAKEIIEDTKEGIPVLDSSLDISTLFEQKPFDQVIVVSQGKVDERMRSEKLMSAINFCEAEGIPLYMVPGFLDVVVRRREVGTLGGLPLLNLRDASVHIFYRVVKRALDILFSLAVLILGAPLWLFLGLMIKLTSPGPVFYAQKRVGLHGKVFNMYKFRSMVQDADERLKDIVDFNNLKEPVFNIRRDPRITTVGKWLRRFSMDEIPQFFNVLQGSMSVVGPRPERVDLVKKYSVYQRRRLKAKPGITGYQQVMSRGDPSLAKRIEYDLFYLKHQSFVLDMMVVLKTFVVIFRGDGVK